MTLQLERDRRTHVQDHLDELTGRVTLIFAVIVGLTLVFSTQIDEWLDVVLTQIDPCTEGCLNLYDPAKWSAVRWLSATLSAILVCAPLLIQQIWAFSNKGLLPNERSWMLRWMIGGTCTAFTFTLVTMMFLVPMTFQYGHAIQTDMGLTAQYDPVLMLSIVLAVIWTQTVVSLAILGMALAGYIGVLNEETADWWRLRCYAIVLMLLYASLPEFSGLAFLLILASILVIETTCGRWFKQPALQSMKSVTLMDEEGGVRRPLIVECRCNGAATPLPSPLNINVPVLRYSGLCSSAHERELLYGDALNAKITDAYITGCSSNPLSKEFKHNCQSIGMRLNGMDLLERQSYRTQPQKCADVEFEIMVAQLSKPWPESKRLNRVIEVMKRNLDIDYVYMSKSASSAWGQQLKPNEVFIEIAQDDHEAFTNMTREIGAHIRDLHPNA